MYQRFQAGANITDLNEHNKLEIQKNGGDEQQDEQIDGKKDD